VAECSFESVSASQIAGAATVVVVMVCDV
jgi:hypothetical protein